MDYLQDIRIFWIHLLTIDEVSPILTNLLIQFKHEIAEHDHYMINPEDYVHFLVEIISL